MSPLRLFYVACLGLLGVLIVFTILHPVAAGTRYSEVQQAQLLETPDQWIVQFDIINQEGRDMGYRVEVLAEERRSTQNMVIKEGRTFTYIYHIYRDSLETGQANFTIYRQDADQPIEQITYHLLDRR